jgi:hAT family C-terminal dimerisation region
VFLIFIIYNIYIIYLLIIFFNSFTSRSTSGGGLLADFQLDSTLHTSTNELLSYMSMLNENEDVDIMTWWKRNIRGYPTLAMMARDVFAVLVSTVPSESCFSSANRILSDKRSKLGAHVFDRLVCFKDWIDAEEHNQYRDQPQSSEVETEESGTEPRPGYNSDSYGAKESEQWYMNANY